MTVTTPGAEPTATRQIALRVRNQLTAHRMPQTELARTLGLAKSGITRRLNGEQAWDVNELVAVAQTIGCPVSELIPDSLYYTTPRPNPGPESPPED